MSYVFEIEKKIGRGELLSIREFQALHTDTCAAVRTDFFPEFCIKHGLAKGTKLTNLLWEAVWKAANEEFTLVTRGKVRMAKAVIVYENVDALPFAGQVKYKSIKSVAQ